MLDAAVQLLAERGVTVALDGLQLEDVIRRADVSRTSAYRRWPTREAFLDDVLLELAGGAELSDVAVRIGNEASELLARHRQALATSRGRHDLLVDLLRQMFQTDLESTLASPQFKTYLALRAAFVGVPSKELRDRLAAALAHSERRAVARGSAVLVGACRLLGLRLSGPLGSGSDGPAGLMKAVAATSTGFVVAALADPAVMRPTELLAPFGSPTRTAWSIPALALTTLVLSQVEPDPEAPVPNWKALAAALPRLVEAGNAAAAAAV